MQAAASCSAGVVLALCVPRAVRAGYARAPDASVRAAVSGGADRLAAALSPVHAGERRAESVHARVRAGQLRLLVQLFFRLLLDHRHHADPDHDGAGLSEAPDSGAGMRLLSGKAVRAQRQMEGAADVSAVPSAVRSESGHFGPPSADLRHAVSVYGGEALLRLARRRADRQKNVRAAHAFAGRAGALALGGHLSAAAGHLPAVCRIPDHNYQKEYPARAGGICIDLCDRGSAAAQGVLF